LCKGAGLEYIVGVEAPAGRNSDRGVFVLGDVAQLVEQRFVDPQVARSYLAVPAIIAA
jgi:hypothetical protein